MLVQKTFAVVLVSATLVGLVLSYFTGVPVMPIWLRVIQWVAMAVLFINSIRIIVVRRART